jgi:hypothetical protein
MFTFELRRVLKDAPASLSRYGAAVPQSGVTRYRALTIVSLCTLKHSYQQGFYPRDRQC